MAVVLASTLAVAAYSWAPQGGGRIVRRAALRAVGETAALVLRVHDPYAGQRGAAVGGLPDRAFLDLPPPHAARVSSTGSHGAVVTTAVTGWHSESVPQAPAFEFEHWDDPGLTELRATPGLSVAVRNSTPDYAGLRSVSAWVMSRLRRGANDPPLATHFDARTILARSAAGEPFDCGTYAWTLVQVLCALGINARLVELEAPDGSGHTVMEAWSGDPSKWIVLDPFTAVTFELNGVPLHALELHRLWHAGRFDRVRVVPGPSVVSHAAAGRDPRELLRYYAHFDVRMRNNVRSARFPRWHPKANRIMSAFEWDGEGAGRAFYRRRVRDSASVYFALETTALRWRWTRADSSERHRLEVGLASCTPNFGGFVYSRDHRTWTPVARRVVVTPRAGRDTLWFASRNRAGRIGRPSWIAVASETRTAAPSHGVARGRRAGSRRPTGVGAYTPWPEPSLTADRTGG